MSKDNEELRKLIAENPDLPLVFMVMNDELLDGNCSTVFESCSCDVETVYFYETSEYSGCTEKCTDDYIEIQEYYEDKFCDNEEYKDLSDADYEEAIKKYIEENIRHYKAIVVSVGY